MSEPTPPKLVLYYSTFCVYCSRVASAVSQFGTDIEGKNIWQDQSALDELKNATGRGTVPVLRIESSDGKVSWLPESNDIIAYLGGLAKR